MEIRANSREIYWQYKHSYFPLTMIFWICQVVAIENIALHITILHSFDSASKTSVFPWGRGVGCSSASTRTGLRSFCLAGRWDHLPIGDSEGSQERPLLLEVCSQWIACLHLDLPALLRGMCFYAVSLSLDSFGLVLGSHECCKQLLSLIFWSLLWRRWYFGIWTAHRFSQAIFNLFSFSHKKSEESVKLVRQYAVRASHHRSVGRPSHTRWRDELPAEPNGWPANASSSSVLQNFSAKAFCCYLISEFFIANPRSELADLLLQGCALCWQMWAWIFALSAWVRAAPG